MLEIQENIVENAEIQENIGEIDKYAQNIGDIGNIGGVGGMSDKAAVTLNILTKQTMFP